jgi:DNA-3-methyladenine glycosylase
LIQEHFVVRLRLGPLGTYKQGSDRSVAYKVRRLRRTELPVDTVGLARYLIGKTLVHNLPGGTVSGRIVETEAYVVGDKAGHAFRGRTPRNGALYLERGHAYVYLIYGLHYLLNVASERVGVGAGVLLRALEPLDGIALMRRGHGGVRLVDLARGPGRLANALRIDSQHDGIDLCAEGSLWLGTAPRPTGLIGRSGRIGITKEAHRLLRFYEQGNPFVSGSNP